MRIEVQGGSDGDERLDLGLIVAFLAEKTRWAAEEIYSLRLPRVWRLMEGFGKLADLRSPDYKPDVKDPMRSIAATRGAFVGSGMGKDRPFDTLPLAIQDWSRRCRESVKHGK